MHTVHLPAFSMDHRTAAASKPMSRLCEVYPRAGWVVAEVNKAGLRAEKMDGVVGIHSTDLSHVNGELIATVKV